MFKRAGFRKLAFIMIATLLDDLERLKKKMVKNTQIAYRSGSLRYYLLPFMLC